LLSWVRVPSYPPFLYTRVRSSAGRAQGCDPCCHGFESHRTLHFYKLGCVAQLARVQGDSASRNERISANADEPNPKDIPYRESRAWRDSHQVEPDLPDLCLGGNMQRVRRAVRLRFPLSELLVVIAILAAMLMPAVAGAVHGLAGALQANAWRRGSGRTLQL
jgi:hypothetical protein